MKNTFATVVELVIMDCPECDEEVREGLGSKIENEIGGIITVCPYCKETFEYFIE